MILSFLLAAAAGLVVPYVEPWIGRLIAMVAQGATRLSATDLRIISLLTLLAISAAIITLMGGETVSFATVLGGGLGYFGLRLYAFFRDPDGTDVPEEERWDGRVEELGTRRTAETTEEPQSDTPAETEPQNLSDEETLREVKAALGDFSTESTPSAQRPEPTEMTRSASPRPMSQASDEVEDPADQTDAASGRKEKEG